MSLPTLPRDLLSRAVTPDDRRYSLLRSTYVASASPALVLLPQNDEEVAAAIVYARDSELPVSVRSGGHGLSGRSSNNGGIVVDLSAMDSVDIIDAGSRLVRVGAGARWANVAVALASHGLAVSSGDHGNVGVGGLATAGGIGWLARTYGLTIDHIRAARVVLPDGSIIRTDRERDPDLFWAVRGAGDGVGIVTSLDIEAMPLGNIGIAQVAIEADRNGDTLRRWSEHLAESPRDLTTNGVLFPNGNSFVLQLTAVVASDDPERIRTLVEPIAELGIRPLGLEAQIGQYSSLVPTAHLHPNYGQQGSNTTNALLSTLTKASSRALMDVAAHPYGPLVQLRSLGGAINDIAEDETAYSHRHQEVLAVITSFPPAGRRELAATSRPLWNFAEGAYRNFDSDPDEATFERAFPGEVGEKVRRLRERYDPDRVLQRT